MPRHKSTREKPYPARLLVRALSGRYLLVLVTVAALVVVDQAIIQPMLVGLSFYAPRINLAGRQRMLSQKVSKEAFVLVLLPDESVAVARRRQLIGTIQEWKAAHRMLAGEARGTNKPHYPDQIVAALHELDAPLAAVVTAATTIATRDQATTDKTSLLQVMLVQESTFLTGMERVVMMLEDAAKREVNWLRLCGLAVMTMILALLGAVYFIVLRPATALIRDQVGLLSASESEYRQLSVMLAHARDELEERVKQRTNELSRANAELAREITERQSSESRNRELASQLAHASRITSLGQLATGLAHEINQPLACIVSYADTAELLLEKDASDPGLTRQAIAQVKQAALRAGAIVRRMRNFVRPGTTLPTRVDLNDLVREVCDLCRPQLEQSGVQFSLEAAPGSIAIEADPIEVQQVLVNIVQNAVQALVECPRDRRTLLIRTVAERDEVHVEIADSGPGFTPQEVDNAFTPFYSTKADGLGMGLAISRTILERYQGRLWAETRPEGGARVVIYLPTILSYDVDPGPSVHSLCR